MPFADNNTIVTSAADGQVRCVPALWPALHGGGGGGLVGTHMAQPLGRQSRLLHLLDFLCCRVCAVCGQVRVGFVREGAGGKSVETSKVGLSLLFRHGNCVVRSGYLPGQQLSGNTMV